MKVGDEVVSTSWDLENVAHSAGVKLSDFKSKKLSFCIGYSNYNGGVPAQKGTDVLDVKNISIYEGVVENTDILPQFQFVTYENERGALLRKDLFDEENGYIMVESFPKTSTTMDSIWVDKATGIIALPPVAGEDPMMITEPMTFVVTEKAPNTSDVLDVQYSEAKDGKQSIRFIGGVYNTNCTGVGFEITARYRKEDGTFVEKTYVLSGTAVYDSIDATESGTMKNGYATDLGAFYIFGAVLDGVPTDIGQIDFEIVPFKTMGKFAIRIDGTPVTVSVKNGVVDCTLKPIA